MKYLHNPVSCAQPIFLRLEQNVFFRQCRPFSDEERPPSPSGAEMVLINILKEKFELVPKITDDEDENILKDITNTIQKEEKKEK